jgi:PDZ domain-containing protein GIPC
LHDVASRVYVRHSLGYCLIKHIKRNSTIERGKYSINIGDHIESINNQSAVGIEHYELAKMIKDIPLGDKISLRLFEPRVIDSRTG